MKRLKVIISVLIICFQTASFAQNNDQKTMKSFVPKTNAYDIYYPNEFKLFEGEDGIVSITDSISGLNFTISSYSRKKKPNDLDVINFLNSFINDSYNKQHKIEDWNSYKSKYDCLVELKTKFENSNWIWYGITSKKSLVVISVNKETEISEDEINLAIFMIDNMIIN